MDAYARGLTWSKIVTIVDPSACLVQSGKHDQ